MSRSSSRTEGRSALAAPSADLPLGFEVGSDGRDFSIFAGVGFDGDASVFCIGLAIISSSRISSSFLGGRSRSGAVCSAAAAFPFSTSSRMASAFSTVAILIFSTMRLIFAASSARTMISHSPPGLSLGLRSAQYTTPYRLASATKRFMSLFFTLKMVSSLPLLSMEVNRCLPLILFLSRFFRAAYSSAATSFAALPVILAATSIPSRLSLTTCSAASPDVVIDASSPYA